MGRQELGATGERLAENFLKKKGYRIVGKNIRSPFGEIDLVAEERRTLVFVEVKTRSGNEFGFPEEAVIQKKQKRLARLASWYVMTRRKTGAACRFDILAVELAGGEFNFRLIQNAFECEE